jgi:hypothetical protein
LHRDGLLRLVSMPVGLQDFQDLLGHAGFALFPSIRLDRF